MRKIALLGTAPTVTQAPSPSDWELWGTGPAIFPRADHLMRKQNATLPRHLRKPLPSEALTAWFEIHWEMTSGKTLKEEDPEYWHWLSRLKCPVYMKDHFPDIPTSVPYPRELMRRAFGPRFGGSSCWMYGWAMYHILRNRPEGQTEPDYIGLWGIHLVEDERIAEKPNLCFLIGQASAHNIITECFDMLIPDADYGWTT